MNAPSTDADALERALRSSNVDLAPGLGESDFDRLHEQLGLDLAPDHRLMLTIGLPVGERWPDWRAADARAIRSQIDWQFDGIVFGVEHSGFWHPGWPHRPDEMAEALGVARSLLAEVPLLAPLYGHRFLPTVPNDSGNPVLSCYQTDIICYGVDLLDWFRLEFHRSSSDEWLRSEPRRVPFWSWFLDPTAQT